MPGGLLLIGKTIMRKMIEALTILAPYYKNGFDEDYVLCAEHDMIYSQVSLDQVPYDSTDGQKLIELGWGADENGEVWTKYV